jgi:hypothetical protein
MKEMNFSFEGELPEEIPSQHKGEGHDLSAEFEAVTTEEGGGRYKKSFFGIDLHVTVRCTCQKQADEPLWTETQSDKVPASGMDELV